MKHVIKIISTFLIIIIMTTKFAFCEDMPIVYSESAILIEKDTGKILYEKNSHERLYPASTTKILTAIIAIERGNLDELATASSTAINSVPSGYATAGIQVGEKFTIEQLLNVMLIYSANEAANIISEHISGSVEEFAKLMNQKAKEIGCNESNFVNCNGMQNENHYSTAYDLALICRYCINNDIFSKIISTTNYELNKTELYDGERIFNNNNDLINKNSKYYYKYCIGGKTGYTKEAKNCLIAVSKKDNMELISVVLKGMNTELGESARNTDTINLFEYGFNNYNLVTIKKKGEILEPVEIINSNGEITQLDVTIENDISAINNVNEADTKNIDPEIQLNVKSTPIEKGEVVGTVTYRINGEDYSSNLLAIETIEDTNIINKNILNIKNIIILIGIFIIFNIIRILNNKQLRKLNIISNKKIYKKGKHAL